MELPMVKEHPPQQDKLVQRQHPYLGELLHEKELYKSQDEVYHKSCNDHAANKQPPWNHVYLPLH